MDSLVVSRQQGELKKHYNLDVSPITTTAMWQIVAKVNEDLWRHLPHCICLDGTFMHMSILKGQTISRISR